jgi:signal peptidase II
MAEEAAPDAAPEPAPIDLAAFRGPLPAELRLKRTRSVAFVIAFLVFALDQAVKWVVAYPLQIEFRGRIEITDFFNLTFVKNSGVSLGLLSADGDLGRWLLVAMTAAIAIFVGLWLWREKRRDDSTALALVLGGALGNIVDRVRLGYVLDYADLHFGDLHPFLVFNVGDAAITIGVLLLLVRALLMRDGRAKKKEA